MITLPCQPPGTPWPDAEWPAGRPIPSVEVVLDRAFCDPQPPEWGVTLAVVVVQRGRLVAERYAPGTGPMTTLLSWSMAKSVTQALVGIRVGHGELDIHAPADVPEWADSTDPRRTITIDQLLRMSSGLAFVEDYVDDKVSDVIDMLFGSGQHDVAHYAATKPLAAPPDTVWNYSSGTTNIVARSLGVTATSIRDDLFDPIGMASASARFDDAGTFVGSSFLYATARDFARFGLLYLRDGVWSGDRILPPGWVDFARCVTPTCETREYGAHWWLVPGSQLGTFYASGYEGQYLYCIPALDAVVVRLGKTPADQRAGVERWVGDLVGALKTGQ